jgi:hypothetical protein
MLQKMINKAFREGWFLRDTYTETDRNGNIQLVAVMVDDMMPLWVRVVELPDPAM